MPALKTVASCRICISDNRRERITRKHNPLAELLKREGCDRFEDVPRDTAIRSSVFKQLLAIESGATWQRVKQTDPDFPDSTKVGVMDTWTAGSARDYLAIRKQKTALERERLREQRRGEYERRVSST